MGFDGPALLSTLVERRMMFTATGDEVSDLGGGIKTIACPYTCVPC